MNPTDETFASKIERLAVRVFEYFDDVRTGHAPDFNDIYEDAQKMGCVPSPVETDYCAICAVVGFISMHDERMGYALSSEVFFIEDLI